MLGERIRQARARKAMSLRALADAAGDISAQAISNYETDKDAPSSGVLLRLAKALEVPIDYFFRTATVELGTPAYRKHCKLSKSEMMALESTVQDAVERYAEAELLISEETRGAATVPSEFAEQVGSLDAIEDRAQALRRAWSIGNGPIDKLTELLEDHGIKVIFMSAGEHFDGCAFPNGKTPVIVVNDAKPADRIRFDLAHELAHLLLRFPEEWDDDAIESAAHRFAGAFLVPADVARMELGDQRSNISVLELRTLKLKYGMSMQAWLHRAKDLEIVSHSTYTRLYRRIIVANGWRISEPFELPERECSTRMQRLVARAYTDSLISDSRAAELLRVSREDFLQSLNYSPQ